MAASKETAHYRVLTGLDYPPARRAEPGDVVNDLPEQSIKWLRAQGYIRRVHRKSTRAVTGDGTELPGDAWEDEEGA